MKDKHKLKQKYLDLKQIMSPKSITELEYARLNVAWEVGTCY